MPKNIYLWDQGNGTIYGPNCSGEPAITCANSERIAHEYSRGFFTLTNVLVPNMDTYTCSNPGIKARQLSEVEVGDTVFLMVIPPHSTAVMGAASVGQSLAWGSDINTLKGMEFTVVTADFNGLEEQTVDGQPTMVQVDACTPENLQDASSAITVDDRLISNHNRGTKSYIEPEVNITSPLANNVWTGVGIRIDALPTGGWENATGYIAVMATCFEMQHQII